MIPPHAENRQIFSSLDSPHSRSRRQKRGYSSAVGRDLPKVEARVQFSLPAPCVYDNN